VLIWHHCDEFDNGFAMGAQNHRWIEDDFLHATWGQYVKVVILQFHNIVKLNVPYESCCPFAKIQKSFNIKHFLGPQMQVIREINS